MQNQCGGDSVVEYIVSLFHHLLTSLAGACASLDVKNFSQSSENEQASERERGRARERGGKSEIESKRERGQEK